MSNRPAVLSFILSQCITVAVFAQLPAARLTSVFPPGGQRGTSVEVTLTGVDLDDVTRLYVSGAAPQIAAEPKLDPATGKPMPGVFVVHIDDDCRPGAYDVCAVGRFGVTNPRTFVVDREPHAAAKAGNTSPDAAAPLAVGSGAYAIAAAQAAQFFRVELKAEQRVFIECDATAIDSKLEPVVTLFDAAGREVARGDEAEPIDFMPATADAGPYVVKVHDLLFRGGPEFFYRLRVRGGARTDAVLPPAFAPDELHTYTLFGRNHRGGTPGGYATDGKPMELMPTQLVRDWDNDTTGLRLRWRVPPQAGMLDGVQTYTVSGLPARLFFGTAAADAPLVPERPDNDAADKAQPVTPPVEVYGQFFPRGDRDWLTFSAKKGESFWVEVISNRTVGITNPMVIVQRVAKNAAGKEQLVDVREAYEPDNMPGMPSAFYAAHRDPAFRFVAPEDGDYRVLVRDLFNDGGGPDDPRRVYRLSIAPAAQREDFRLVAWPQAPQPLTFAPGTPAPTQAWGSNVRPGGVMPISVLAFRTGGFAGDITLTATGLPPGVTCPSVVMNGGTNSATLLLAADENARPWAGPIQIIGAATRGGESAKRLLRNARPGTVVWTVANQELEPLRSRVAQELVIAVTGGEPEPLAVQPAEDKVWEESVAGKVEVPLKVTRRMGYAGVVKLKPAGSYDKVLALPEVDVAAGATDVKLALDFGALGLPPGIHAVYLQATSTGAYDRDPALRAAAQAQKDAADKATPELTTTVQKATEALTAAKAASKPEQVAPAEKALAEANEKVKQNEASKAALAERIKALQPKDTLAYGYSTPIRLKVTPAPITLAPPTPAAPVTLKPGGAKADVSVSITRLYNFAGQVDLSVTIPQGVAGISAANVSIAANAAQGVLSVQAAADAKPGEYTLTLAANLKQNDRPVKVEQPLKVTIVAP